MPKSPATLARFHPLRPYRSGQARRAIMALSSQVARMAWNPYRSMAPSSAAPIEGRMTDEHLPLQHAAQPGGDLW